MNKDIKLGRGLDALINPQSYNNNNSNNVEQDKTIIDVPKEHTEQLDVIAKIPIHIIHPNPYQPRINFEPEAFNELKNSILANGLIQPVTVRRKEANYYELISGERRLRACKELGYKDIPAYIIKVDSNESMLALALIENIQREVLNPIEVGTAYKRLMDECKLTQEQIAERVGKDRTTVANSIRLLRLPDVIQNALISNEISSGHARALINLSSPALQIEMMDKIKQGNLSVRKVEQLVKKIVDAKTEKKTSFKSDKINTSDNSLRDLEDKLRRVFATKVICRQKSDGAGEITIEFYSHDELERIFELIDTISKTYN